jgi:hypothetical protein
VVAVNSSNPKTLTGALVDRRIFMYAALLLPDELPRIGEIEVRPCDGEDDDDEKREQKRQGEPQELASVAANSQKMSFIHDPP